MKLKLRNNNKFLRIFFTFSIFLIGIVVGIAIRHYYNIPLSQEINIVDVAMLLTTVFLAVYVPSVLDRQMQVMRDKGNVIEQRIVEFQGLIRRINLIVQSGVVNYEGCLSINNLLDICDHRLETIVTLLSYYDKSDSYKQEINKVKAFCKKRRELLFMEQVPQEGKKFTKEERDHEEELYNQIDRSSSLLLFKVNDI
ncbi:MAG: hypothetical protein LBI15_11685 [Dysgonamonadaceae bacterium]|jgi:hypothetical protein|nr:hypothetical protein [Dysgonamonadaceae bacterium]